MFNKLFVSITSAAILVAGPGHFAVAAAALTMSRGPAAGIAVLPMIGPGMNSPIPNASLNLLAPSALTVPSLTPVIAAVPAAVQPQALAAVLPAAAKAVPAAVLPIIQPQANIGTEEEGAALNAAFDNSLVAGRVTPEEPGQPAVPAAGNAPSASGAQKTLPLSRRMESLYSILAFTEGAMYETRDGRRWSASLVRGRLDKLLNQIDAAHSQVASSPARIALTYARAMTAAEITDSLEWQTYGAGSVGGVFNTINGYITQAINGEKQQGPDASSPSEPIAPQAERLESLHLLSAAIEAAIYETRDGRPWSIGLVRGKLTGVLSAEQPAFEKVVASEAKIALIRIRAIAEGEIADSGSWYNYSSRAVHAVFSKLRDYVAQAIKNESSL